MEPTEPKPPGKDLARAMQGIEQDPETIKASIRQYASLLNAAMIHAAASGVILEPRVDCMDFPDGINICAFHVIANGEDLI